MIEMNQPLVSFQSKFARQLHKNEAMRRRNPLATYKRTHQQMGIELNEPRKQRDYNQQNGLQ